MSQFETKSMTTNTLLKGAGFRAGWEDVAAGRAADPKWVDTEKTNDAWGYARGRAVALDILTHTHVKRLPPIKNGARLNNDAIRAWNALMLHNRTTNAPSAVC